MKKVYKLKKGLDFNLEGAALASDCANGKSVPTLPLPQVVAVRPTDFTGVQPKLVVKEGATVLAGDALFVDKATETIQFVSPVSGVVSRVVRGERRKLLRIEVQADKSQQYKQFATKSPAECAAADAVKLLVESGLFAFVRQRPYDVIASPSDSPKAIFVSAFNKMPLAADFNVACAGQEEDFKAGIRLLARIAKVHLGISPEQVNSPLLPVSEACVDIFEGPNPSGNVGVQINQVDPINKGEIVWTVGHEAVVLIGRFLRLGHVDFTRTIAVAGSELKKPTYLKTLIGAPLKDVLGDNLKRTEHVRIINGNPFVGEKADLEDFLGAFSTEVCAIPEGDDVDEPFGWIAPRLNDFSTSYSYFSRLLGKNRSYNLDCRIKGGERHIIMSGEYDRVFPMDIYAGYLVKAILTEDIDRQEALGIYEVAPEDFAVAEFVDSSKLELQRIVREGLDRLRKENS